MKTPKTPTLKLDELNINGLTFPTPKEENFRYFPLHLLRDKEFTICPHDINKTQLPPFVSPLKDSTHTLWIINGVPHITDDIKSFVNIKKEPIKAHKSIESIDFFKQIHLQESKETTHIHLNDSTIHLIFLYNQDQCVDFPSIVIHNQGKSAVYSSFISCCPLNYHLSIPYIQIINQEHSHLDFHTMVNLNPSEFILPYFECIVPSDSSIFKSISHIRGSLSRFFVESVLDGKKAHFNLEGIYHTQNKEQLEIFVKAYHMVEDSHSNQFFKGIAHDQSHFSFNGDIIVKPETPLITAHQLSKNLLLGKQAKIMVRPQLHVKHHQIQCSHGAAIGGINPDQLFYLNSRGITLEDAKKLLLKGFLDEIIQHYPCVWADNITEQLETKRA